MTVYPISKCPTFLAAMGELFVHTWMCKFGLVAGMDKTMGGQNITHAADKLNMGKNIPSPISHLYKTNMDI